MRPTSFLTEAKKAADDPTCEYLLSIEGAKYRSCMFSLFSEALSGRICETNLTMAPPNGRRSIVVPTLKIRCALAICLGTSPGESHLTIEVNGRSKVIVVHIIIPITLKVRCISAVLLAILLVPIDERIAVIHVPIFIPYRMQIA